MRLNLGAQQVDKGGVAPGDAALVADEEEVFTAGGERRGKTVLDVADEFGLRPGAVFLGVGDVEARVTLQPGEAREEKVGAVGGDGGGELVLVRGVHRRVQFLRDGILTLDEARNIDVVDAALSRGEVEVTIGGGGEGPVDAQVVDDSRQRVWHGPSKRGALGYPDVLFLRGVAARDSRGGEEEEARAIRRNEGGTGGMAGVSRGEALEGGPGAVYHRHGAGEGAILIRSAPVDRVEIRGEDRRGMQLTIEDTVGENLRLSTRQGLGKVGLRGQGRGDGCGSRGCNDGVERAVNQHSNEDHQADVSKSFHHKSPARADPLNRVY